MTRQTSLGGDLRALRTARRMTIEDLAEKLGRSIGWVSQIERDMSTPKLADLQKLADVFDVPLSLFFGEDNATNGESGLVVRAQARRMIGERQMGLIETLISPDLTDSFEMVHSTFQPGAKLEEPLERATQELAFMVSGRLDIWLGDQMFTVEAGDSFRIRQRPFRWSNPYDEPAIAVWVISPPVY
ncbi:transcriptional regulator, XRE family with cupin sensor [Cohaesibacter sp. ES.047]|uniref:helix-turn-helix domain-containing protein n=1 Tax=Cohaesibacter sp. ES.047 TaxID=1798205 RepID=UPI000BB80167|nr:helix-turn-helix domain-containing protein [Cohaesibacter sp. ES.047]SNY91352.1 transcriptional regulator, XRE family with cupin sensor [Cohaesibacter sp. ES.047]